MHAAPKLCTGGLRNNLWLSIVSPSDAADGLAEAIVLRNNGLHYNQSFVLCAA